MLKEIRAFLQNPAKRVCLIKTRDYQRVQEMVQGLLYNLNLEFHVELTLKAYVPHQREESLNEFINSLRSQEVGVIWMEKVEGSLIAYAYHFCKGKLVLLTPVFHQDPYAEGYVSVIEDDYNYDLTQEIREINQSLSKKGKAITLEKDPIPAFRGLSRVEAVQVLWDSVIEREGRLSHEYVMKKKRLILEKDTTLQLLEPQEVDTAVGLEKVKEIILSCYRSGLGKGTLLLGVAGVGKTLLAENLAKEVPVIRFNVGRIYSKYVGESEERLESALHRLKAFGEGIVFIDEIEKALASTTFGNDGGVSMRVLGMLLGWMQRREGNLYLLGTANRIEMLPPELIRPERWDFIFGITFPPPWVMKRVIEYYSKKYNREVEPRLLQEQYLTPADVSSIYRVSAMTGLDVMSASGLVKRTRNLYPKVEDALQLIEKYSVCVFDLNKEEVLL